MISKRIHCNAASDNYGRLADYIADHGKEIKHVRRLLIAQKPYLGRSSDLAKNGVRRLSLRNLAECRTKKQRLSAGFLPFDARRNRRDAGVVRWRDVPTSGKCSIKWCAGCWSGDDYALGIREVQATQALNTRTGKEKTYHLVVSFRPEDVAKLTPDILKTIETRFAEALGLADHQRHCGVHINTEHAHLHVAYNLIHPERLTRVEPYRDYIARDKLCRQLEKEYGLAIDNGRLTKGRSDRLVTNTSSAATVEAHTGEQSFESYAQEQCAASASQLEQATSWEELHAVLAQHGLTIKPRGAGLVVGNRHGKQHVKASAVSRGFSLKSLEARFGKYVAGSKENLPESQTRYGKRPLHKDPNRSKLWDDFQAIRADQQADYAASKKKWQDYRSKIAFEGIGQKLRTQLMRVSKAREAEERHNISMRYPANWMDYLQGMAARGNEAALDVLRSRNEIVRADHAERQKQQERAYLLAAKTAIAEDWRYTAKEKAQLVSQAVMKSIVPEFSAQVSKQGTVIFTLPSGAKIHDTGKRIIYDDQARTEALAYMATSWGVRRVERSRMGQQVYVLGSGQKVSAGQNSFEKPAFSKERQRSSLER